MTSWARLATTLIGVLTVCPARAADPAYREPNPHWATFESPFPVWGVAQTTAPRGYHFCGIAESYSSLEPVFVFLDPKIRCENLSLQMNQEAMPDFIMIEAGPDAAIQYESTSDLVKGEPFYCNGLSYDKAPQPITKAHTSIARAGKRLAGMNTMTCTRDDQESGRYSKAYLAFRPMVNQSSETFQVAAYVHSENKRKADALLDQIVRSMKLVK